MMFDIGDKYWDIYKKKGICKCCYRPNVEIGIDIDEMYELLCHIYRPYEKKKRCISQLVDEYFKNIPNFHSIESLLL